MSFRKIIFWLHLIAGVLAGVVILIMSLTGALLAFERQIVEFAERDLRYVVPPADARRLPVDELISAAREKNPDARPSAISFRSDPAASVTVNFGREGGMLYLNPYTGAALGTGSKTHDFMHWIEDWHRWLGSREKGKPVTGAANLIFLFLAVSGLYIWWPRNGSWNAMRQSVWFVGGLRGKARDWNWHNTIGLWCAPVLIILTLTGVVMSYQWANNLLYRATGNEPPPPQTRQNQSGEGRGERRRESADADAESEEREPLALDALLAKAGKQVSGWKSISLRLARPGAPVAFTIVEPASWHPNPRSTLTLDPFTGETAKWEPFSGQNLGRKLRMWVRVLHTGEAGRIPGQLIALLACVGGVALVWTGFAMAWRRFFSRADKTGV